MDNNSIWERCSSCKKPILFGSKYFLCSVTTCRHPRTGVRSCSADCWDAHLGSARHREAWAEEAVAPRASEQRSVPTPATMSTNLSSQDSAAAPRAPVRKIFDSPPSARPAAAATVPSDLETLVVVSKIKQLIREQSGFNTSQCCIDALTAKVAAIALKAVESARASGRKTVMGRDVE